MMDMNSFKGTHGSLMIPPLKGTTFQGEEQPLVAQSVTAVGGYSKGAE